MSVPCNRRLFLSLVLVAGGLGAACGVKGPLYLPPDPDPETEKEKKKDAEKTSRRESVPANATHS